MEPTTEMRWWWQGSPGPEVDAWFTGLRGVVRDEARTDHYLMLASDPETGIKVRAGELLEIKSLVHRERGVRATGVTRGTLEQWVKWSFALAPETADEAYLAQDDRTWIRTGKYRWLVDVDAGEIEVAEVDVADQRWWSLAVEVAGDGGTGRGRLVDALRWLAATSPPPQLDLVDERSYGYAELLSRLRGAT